MPATSPNPSPSIAELRTLASPVTATAHRSLPFGVEPLDRRLAGEGLRAGALHEVTAQRCSAADEAAATLFIAGIAAREASASGAPVLWVSCRDDLYAPGVDQAGLHAANVIYAQPKDEQTLLAVIEDAVRDGTPTAIIAEARKVSMVASRRLQLAAADADLPVLLLRLRNKRDRDPLAEPSAAWTRWRIASARSEPLPVPGVGRPRWMVELARQRNGEPFSLLMQGCDGKGQLAAVDAGGLRISTEQAAHHAAA